MRNQNMKIPTTKNIKVEIFTVVKDGEYILPLYLEHYQNAFPGCVINIYDNNSSDNSVKLCRNAGCVIRNFPDYSFDIEQAHKNSVWKNSTADWVIVCDQDELVQISASDLLQLKSSINVIQFRGYNMLSTGKQKDPKLFDHGFPSQMYDKCLMFKPTITEIGYTLGSHFIAPKPKPTYSQFQFNLYHYNKSWFTLAEFIKRHSPARKEDLITVYKIALKDKIKLHI